MRWWQPAAQSNKVTVNDGWLGLLLLGLLFASPGTSEKRTSMADDSVAPPHPRTVAFWAARIFLAVVIVLVLMRMGRQITMTSIGLALILGGALGNVYDRIKTGAVIDFLEVHIVHYHWPDFNVADSAIVCGGILLVLHSLISAREWRLLTASPHGNR